MKSRITLRMGKMLEALTAPAEHRGRGEGEKKAGRELQRVWEAGERAPLGAGVCSCRTRRKKDLGTRQREKESEGPESRASVPCICPLGPGVMSSLSNPMPPNFYDMEVLGHEE